MQKKRILMFCWMVTSSLGSTVFGAMKGKEVTYQVEGKNFRGYLAQPTDLSGKVPGVIVIGEWWGLNEYAKHRAEQVAQEFGYVAFAIDMYGDGKVAKHPEDAKKLSEEASSAQNISVRFQKAFEVLKNDPHVDPDQMAAIGYCFGGKVILTEALMGLPLKGVASFHGALPTAFKISLAVQAKLLILNGGADPFITPEAIANFKSWLDKEKIHYQWIDYPDAKHGFTDPQATQRGIEFKMPLAYQANADHQSWSALKEFFGKIFKLAPKPVM